MDLSVEKRTSWLERPVLTTLVLNWELVLFATILILAVFTRFYDLEARVMSHDENSHVYYSWLLSAARATPTTRSPTARFNSTLSPSRISCSATTT